MEDQSSIQVITPAHNRYFKILSHTCKHYNYQYVDGLNKLDGKFNNDPTESCCPGRLYITKLTYIHKFYSL